MNPALAIIFSEKNPSPPIDLLMDGNKVGGRAEPESFAATDQAWDGFSGRLLRSFPWTRAIQLQNIT